MKKITIYGALAITVIVGASILLTGCNKSKVESIPSGSAGQNENIVAGTATAGGEDNQQPDQLEIPAPVHINSPKIYGVGFNVHGVGGWHIHEVNFNNGLESMTGAPQTKPITFSGSPIALYGVVFGIARKQLTNTNAAVLTVSEVCPMTGTSLYNVDLNTGGAVRLGNLPLSYVKDIEFNPINQALYGIYHDNIANEDHLIRVISYGAGCPSPVAATYSDLGILNALGAGPFSIAFKHNGDCYIISATDHKVGIISYANLVPGLAVVYSSMTSASPAMSDLMGPVETAACISGTTLMMADTDDDGKRFYHWNSPAWTYKGPRCLVDYTSFATTGLRRDN
jgi:hypothetical protein